jgi:LysM repeat protein
MLRHTVKKGDTLGRVARQYYGDAGLYTLIVSANDISDPDILVIGQQLVIPDASTALRSPSPASPAATSAPRSTGVLDINEKRLQAIHPVVAVRGRTLVELCAHRGISILITQGLRTWAEQDALYAKGRSIPPLGKKYVVTNAKGGQSFHNFGLAFDVVILDSVGKADWNTSHPGWREAAAVGKSLGLEWGGDWTSFKDLPHYQYLGGLSLPRCRELYPSGLPALWECVS